MQVYINPAKEPFRAATRRPKNIIAKRLSTAVGADMEEQTDILFVFH
jgi:hypothetical protein